MSKVHSIRRLFISGNEHFVVELSKYFIQETFFFKTSISIFIQKALSDFFIFHLLVEKQIVFSQDGNNVILKILDEKNIRETYKCQET